jgi:hypothetical protein
MKKSRKWKGWALVYKDDLYRVFPIKAKALCVKSTSDALICVDVIERVPKKRKAAKK